MIGCDIETPDKDEREPCCKLDILFCCIVGIEPCTFIDCNWVFSWFSWDCGTGDWDCCIGCTWGWGSCPSCRLGIGFLNLLGFRKLTICFSLEPNFSLKLGVMLFLETCKHVIKRSNLALNTSSFSSCSDFGCCGRESSWKAKLTYARIKNCIDPL